MVLEGHSRFQNMYCSIKNFQIIPWPRLSNSPHISLPLHNFTHDPLFPLLLLDTVHVLEYLIHLLECLARRLRDEEKRENKRKKAENGEKCISTVACILNERRGDKALRVSDASRIRTGDVAPCTRKKMNSR